MEAMILAAGIGSRLAPLTHRVPKPLVACAGRRLIDWSFDLVRAVGLGRVVINAHHLGEALAQQVGARYGQAFDLRWSFEETLRGTGGGIRGASSHFADETVLIANADILIELDMAAMLAAHRAAGAEATMAVHPANEEGYGLVRRDRRGRINDLRGSVARIRAGLDPVALRGEALPPGFDPSSSGEPYLFRGIHLLEPSFVAAIPDTTESCIVGETYIPRLVDGAVVHGFETHGRWADAGTPARLFAAHQLFWDHAEPVVEAGAELGDRVELSGMTQVAAGARIGQGCRLHDVLVQPGAGLAPGTVLSRAVVYGERGEAWSMEG